MGNRKNVKATGWERMLWHTVSCMWHGCCIQELRNYGYLHRKEPVNISSWTKEELMSNPWGYAAIGSCWGRRVVFFCDTASYAAYAPVDNPHVYSWKEPYLCSVDHKVNKDKNVKIDDLVGRTTVQREWKWVKEAERMKMTKMCTFKIIKNNKYTKQTIFEHFWQSRQSRFYNFKVKSILMIHVGPLFVKNSKLTV